MPALPKVAVALLAMAWAHQAHADDTSAMLQLAPRSEAKELMNFLFDQEQGWSADAEANATNDDAFLEGDGTDAVPLMMERMRRLVRMDSQDTSKFEKVFRPSQIVPSTQSRIEWVQQHRKNLDREFGFFAVQKDMFLGNMRSVTDKTFFREIGSRATAYNFAYTRGKLRGCFGTEAEPSWRDNLQNSSRHWHRLEMCMLDTEDEFGKPADLHKWSRELLACHMCDLNNQYQLVRHLDAMDCSPKSVHTIYGKELEALMESHLHQHPAKGQLQFGLNKVWHDLTIGYGSIAYLNGKRLDEYCAAQASGRLASSAPTAPAFGLLTEEERGGIQS